VAAAKKNVIKKFSFRSITLLLDFFFISLLFVAAFAAVAC
jgi:hypothetical protein